MGVDASFAGREYPPTPVFQVGREHVREFADAVQAKHATHFSIEAAQAAGYTDLVAPPTFAVIIAQQAEKQFIADPAAGIDRSEEHTSELQSRFDLVCRLLLEKKNIHTVSIRQTT